MDYEQDLNNDDEGEYIECVNGYCELRCQRELLGNLFRELTIYEDVSDITTRCHKCDGIFCGTHSHWKVCDNCQDDNVNPGSERTNGIYE